MTREEELIARLRRDEKEKMAGYHAITADVDATIARWRKPGHGQKRLSAFDAWLALGQKPWANVRWANVRVVMIERAIMQGASKQAQ